MIDATPAQAEGLPNTLFADQLEIRGKVLTVQDVVIIALPAGETLGLFLSAVQENGGLFGLVEC